MSIETIKDAVLQLIGEYPINKVILFGSRANGTCVENSDVDLIMEFSAPVTLITLSAIKLSLEEMLQLSVDVIHGPVTADDMIEVDKEVVLYAA
ncbi:MAG TPA: nucleotidyltransferase domain-containing protein [Candidatus Avanaerovorax faecigallinarum]|nr:nucleotidyltransferase domain-containing protein [Candidatus Avanaerovorax faecigallinarum]